MDLRGNRFGGSFEVNASQTERLVILHAIAETGLGGFDERDEKRKKKFGPEVVAAVTNGNDWTREVAKTVSDTLAMPGHSTDTQALAARAALRMQIDGALEQHPRR